MLRERKERTQVGGCFTTVHSDLSFELLSTMFSPSARSTLRWAAPKAPRSLNTTRNLGSFRPALRNTSKPWVALGALTVATTLAYTMWEYKPEMLPSCELTFSSANFRKSSRSRDRTLFPYCWHSEPLCTLSSTGRACWCASSCWNLPRPNNQNSFSLDSYLSRRCQASISWYRRQDGIILEHQGVRCWILRFREGAWAGKGRKIRRLEGELLYFQWDVLKIWPTNPR